MALRSRHSTSCAEPRPPPIELHYLDIYHSTSLRSVRPWLHEPHSLFAALHSEVLIFDSISRISHSWCLTRKHLPSALHEPCSSLLKTDPIIGGASFGSTCHPTDWAFGIHHQEVSWLFLSYSSKLEKEQLGLRATIII